MSGLKPLAEATSSRLLVANEDELIGIPAFLQARAVASSPSEWATHCMAVGATSRGMVVQVLKRRRWCR